MTAVFPRGRQPRLVELLDPGKYFPILEAFSSYLTLADFLALCRVCKGFYGLKTCILSRVTNINIRLKAFVDDPIKFRSLLGNCDALVSGTFALNFFELGHQIVRFLDVFVQNGENANRFTRYIEENEKYQDESLGGDTDTQTRYIYGTSTRLGKKIRITQTSGCPVRAVLTTSSTTACVNFITWNKAYSMFPRQTLINHQFYPLGPMDDEFGSNLRELSDQGWTTRNIIWPDLPNVHKVDTLRRVGDDCALVIPLETNTVQQPSRPDFVIEYAQFRVSNRDLRQPGTFPIEPRPASLLARQNIQNLGIRSTFLTITAAKLESPALRYEYCIASSEWDSYVSPRLKRWAWLELYKMEPESRPSPLNFSSATPLLSDLYRFEKPKSWDYADDEIPKWYRTTESNMK